MSAILDVFSQPFYLALVLGALPLVWWVSRRSLSGLGQVRRWLSLGLRCLVLVLLILALAETRWLWRNEKLAVIFLIDRSASVPPAHQKAAFDFAREASLSRDREQADFVGCVVFGRNAGIESSPKDEELFKGQPGFNVLVERDGTDIQGALRLALAAFPEGYARRVVLISDGNENRGDALEEARAAVKEGATIDVLSVRYEYGGEMLIDKVVVDPEVHIGEPYDVRVVVESTREADAVVRVFENGAPVSSLQVTLKAGKNIFSVPRRHDDASQHSFAYEAHVEAVVREGDNVLQNNSAHAFTFIRGQPRVLLCSDEPELDGALVRALEDERIAVEVTRPELLSGDVSGYLRYSSVILSNVAAHQLSAEKMQMFESLVKGAGMGFVMLGGESSFGAGGYLGTPVEELLPVYMDVKQKKTLPNGALAIVMHSCEINNGNYWSKATVQAAIRALSPQDYAGVLYYGGMGGETWLFPMMPCSNKGLMLNRLEGFNVGDMPDFSRIFTMAHQSLRTTPASIKHIIVFSDGDPSMPTDRQLQNIRADNITISTICMGFHSTPANMEKLAQDGGGNYYLLTGPDNLPEIFIREAVTVRKALIQERDFAPIVHRGGSFLAGIDLQTLPPLKGYVIASEKEAADHFLKAPPAEGDVVLDPILSSWQYGLGKSVAFTSDSGRKWASAWGGWDQYRKFWGQAVRWVSKVQTDDRFRLTQEREGDSAVVYIDAIDPDGRYVNDIDFEATVVSPGPEFKDAAAPVRQVAPGRYRVEFPLAKQGNYLLSLKYAMDGQTRVYTSGLVNPFSPEFRSLSTNDALLAQLADASGGQVLDRIEGDEERREAIFRRDFPVTRTPQDLWRDLLALAAALFFVDVFVRRVVIDWGKLARRAHAAALALARRRRPEAAKASDERLGALLKKKAEIEESREGFRKFYAPSETAGGEARLDQVFVAGADSPDAGEARAAAAEASKPPAAAAPPPQESYTSRLLAAKRRALKRPEGQGEDAKGDG